MEWLFSHWIPIFEGGKQKKNHEAKEFSHATPSRVDLNLSCNSVRWVLSQHTMPPMLPTNSQWKATCTRKYVYLQDENCKWSKQFLQTKMVAWGHRLLLHCLTPLSSSCLWSRRFDSWLNNMCELNLLGVVLYLGTGFLCCRAPLKRVILGRGEGRGLTLWW